ncbi:MAG: hypothetical protein ABR552_09240 [Actinomycetota bacterium]|nr:hypothetical protein [Actinomycetota bacterium]
MRRALILATAVITAAVAVVGFAKSTSVSSKTLGAGKTTVSKCDTDGVSVLETLSGSNIASVAVGSIASACAGGTVSVAVNNGTANSTGSGTVPGGGGSVTVTLGTAVAAKDVVEVDVSISGP